MRVRLNWRNEPDDVSRGRMSGRIFRCLTPLPLKRGRSFVRQPFVAAFTRDQHGELRANNALQFVVTQKTFEKFEETQKHHRYEMDFVFS